MKLSYFFLRCLAGGVVLVAVTRLPQLLSGHMLPDGDEAILGLMAKHMGEGKSLPIFFYGQSFGFSFFEAGAASIFFKLFGVSVISLKASMLLLWGLGCLFLFLAIRHFSDERTAAIALLLLIFCPAWFSWSMKARGGYLTAFLFANICLWLIGRICREEIDRRVWWVGLGCCLGVVALAQPIWLIALLPFLVFLHQNRLDSRALIAAGAGALGTVVLIFLVSLGNRSTYWSPNLLENSNLLGAFIRLPLRVWVNLTGAYYMTEPVAAGPFTMASTALWFLMFAAGVVRIVRSWKRDESITAGHAAVFSLLCVLVFSMVVGLHYFGFRHMLPVSGFLVIFIAGELTRFLKAKPQMRNAAIGLLALVVFLGALSSFEFRNLPPGSNPGGDPSTEKEAIETLIEDLASRGVRHAYSSDLLTQWIITFMSEERIIVRWFDSSDRYPEYPRAVDRALFAGKPVAIIGSVGQEHLLVGPRGWMNDSEPERRYVADRFFIIDDPSVNYVVYLGYELNN